jgi:hypothetical protein
VQFTLGAMPPFQKSNVLSGTTGVELSPLHKNSFSLPLMQSFYISHNCLCRAMSTIHAIFITIISLNFVFWSDLYSENQFDGLITLRSSLLSTFALGVRCLNLLKLLLL